MEPKNERKLSNFICTTKRRYVKKNRSIKVHEKKTCGIYSSFD
jgi:hypothetical protein